MSTTMNRREALGALAVLSVRSFIAPSQGDAPPLAPGAPQSPERLALIESFKTATTGLDKQFEARTFRRDWSMPYRLFRPKANGRQPLVMFLHGSGGLGVDNEKQMGLGNIFGTRLWATAAIERRFPCFVVVPQTDRGWAKYGDPAPGDSVARIVPGLGDGAKLAMELVDALVGELSIDPSRIYVAGQSMGGAGVWNMTAHRPTFFAAAIACCGSATLDDPVASARTPVWNFHGDADDTVPVDVSRRRVAALRKAGAHLRSTEYAGVKHNAWEWAFTEPGLPAWLFAQRRG